MRTRTPMRPPSRHHVPRVDQQVEEDLFELAGVDPGAQATAVGFQLHADAAAQAPICQVDEVDQQRVDVDDPGFWHLAAAHPPQLLGQGHGALAGGQDHPDILALVTVQFVEIEDLGAVDDDAHQVAEVVRDAPGQLSDGVQAAPSVLPPPSGSGSAAGRRSALSDQVGAHGTEDSTKRGVALDLDRGLAHPVGAASRAILTRGDA